MFERASAIASVLSDPGRNGPKGEIGCRLGEIRGWSLLQMAGFKDTIGNVEAILERLVGIAPPKQIGNALAADRRLIMRTGPEQFWIVGSVTDELAAALGREIDGGTGALTSLSHSRTRILIEGERARHVLSKGITIDLHPSVFGPHDFAMTGLHHTPILVLCTGPNRYEVWAMRTFALTVWEWLIDAAWPEGYEVTTGGDPTKAR